MARLLQRSQDVGLVKLVGFVGNSSLDYNRVLQPPRHGGVEVRTKHGPLTAEALRTQRNTEAERTRIVVSRSVTSIVSREQLVDELGGEAELEQGFPRQENCVGARVCKCVAQLWQAFE